MGNLTLNIFMPDTSHTAAWMSVRVNQSGTLSSFLQGKQYNAGTRQRVTQRHLTGDTERGFSGSLT